MPDTATRIKQISTVCVSVADTDRAIDFYVGKLGFEKRTDTPFGNGYRWVEVAPGDAVTTIALAPPPPGGEANGVVTGIALETDDAEADRNELAERGVDVDETVTHMGGPVPPMFWFRDPDGNTLMVVQTG